MSSWDGGLGAGVAGMGAAGIFEGGSDKTNTIYIYI